MLSIISLFEQLMIIMKRLFKKSLKTFMIRVIFISLHIKENIVFLVNLLIGGAFELIGEERIGTFLGDIPVVGVLCAALVGLVPNCAASVLIATLFTRGVISGGAMLAGLLTGAGAGLLVLFRTNKHHKQNLLLAGVLLLTGILFGCLFDLTGLAALLGL